MNDEIGLVAGLLRRDWLRGEPLLALARCEHGSSSKYKVTGLDIDGSPKRGFFERVFSRFDDEHSVLDWPAVRGDRPDCLAVGFFRALAVGESWLAITPSRFAALRLRDAQVKYRADEQVGQRMEPGLGGMLKGIGGVLKGMAGEVVGGAGRPPLTQRPADASVQLTFEVHRGYLAAVRPWRPPMVPEFKHGDRHVEVHFTDGSSARLQTDAPGQAALVPPAPPGAQGPPSPPGPAGPPRTS